MALAWRSLDPDHPEPQREPTPNDDDRRAALWTVLARNVDLPDLAVGRPSWHAHAVCHGRTEVMFSTSRAAVAEAKALCQRCPAIKACARDAIERGEKHGTWGGLSEDDRRAFSTRRKA